jgi:hypothetical protein
MKELCRIWTSVGAVAMAMMAPDDESVEAVSAVAVLVEVVSAVALPAVTGGSWGEA